MSTDVTLHENQSPQTTEARTRRFLKPHYEVTGEKDAYLVRVYMPGVAKDGVNISLDRKRIHIEGNRREVAREGWKPVFREISDADYRLQLDLNVDIDDQKIEAHTENGVLNLRLPVSESSKPRSIKVE